MMTWFTSDEHLGHKNAMLGWGNPERARPFSTLDDMREGLLANHNSVVHPGDVVYHLGDMFWRSLQLDKAKDYVRRLNGFHYYIRGNHEELLDRHRDELGTFGWIRERHSLLDYEIGPKSGKEVLPIVLDHYAGSVWDGSHRGSWQLYGHSHGGRDNDHRYEHLLSLDVGVDSWGMFPVSLQQIAGVMAAKKERLEGNY